MNLLLEYNNKIYRLDHPISVGRQIKVRPQYKGPQAFHLPIYTTETFEVDGFKGDISEGGPCTVEIHNYSPHNQTHIETAAHVSQEGKTIDQIPKTHLSGIVNVIQIDEINDDYFYPSHLEGKLGGDYQAIAIKTSSSSFPSDHDYTGTNPIAPHHSLGKYLKNSGIKILMLDLPSADKEQDDGKLLMHRSFFGLPETGPYGEDKLGRIIIELANFTQIEEGIYYYVTTPLRVGVDAISTDIWFYKLILTKDPEGSLQLQL